MILLADRPRPQIVFEVQVFNQVRGLGQVLPVSFVLLLKAVKLRHIECPLAITQAVQKLHVVLEESHLFLMP